MKDSGQRPDLESSSAQGAQNQYFNLIYPGLLIKTVFAVGSFYSGYMWVHHNLPPSVYSHRHTSHYCLAINCMCLWTMMASSTKLSIWLSQMIIWVGVNVMISMLPSCITESYYLLFADSYITILLADKMEWITFFIVSCVKHTHTHIYIKKNVWVKIPLTNSDIFFMA